MLSQGYIENAKSEALKAISELSDLDEFLFHPTNPIIKNEEDLNMAESLRSRFDEIQGLSRIAIALMKRDGYNSSEWKEFNQMIEALKPRIERVKELLLQYYNREPSKTRRVCHHG